MTQDTQYTTYIYIDNKYFDKMKQHHNKVQTLDDNGTEVIILKKERGTKNDCVFYNLEFIFEEGNFNFGGGLRNLISIYQMVEGYGKVSELYMHRTCFLKLEQEDNNISETTDISDENLTKWLEEIAQNLGLERSKIYVLTGGTVGRVMSARDDVENLLKPEGWEVIDKTVIRNSPDREEIAELEEIAEILTDIDNDCLKFDKKLISDVYFRLLLVYWKEKENFRSEHNSYEKEINELEQVKNLLENYLPDASSKCSNGKKYEQLKDLYICNWIEGLKTIGQKIKFCNDFEGFFSKYFDS